MSNIREVIKHLPDSEGKIGAILIEFYDTMKALEKDELRGGKQATKIVMTINDIAKIIKEKK